MYVPEHFRICDHSAAFAFMKANPFAILVSSTDDGPFASHIPVALRQSGEQVIVRGHFAKANAHWRYLDQLPECLTIFHGPHSYISPTLYTDPQSVPTWNYGAVHVYGNARTFSAPEELLEVLHELMGIFEPGYAAQWAGLNGAYRQKMLTHIVGFEITATKIEAKFKLNQNRTREDQQNVIAALSKSDDSVVSGVAHLMQQQSLGKRTSPKRTIGTPLHRLKNPFVAFAFWWAAPGIRPAGCRRHCRISAPMYSKFLSSRYASPDLSVRSIRR
jgi:transcriptional regulator